MSKKYSLIVPSWYPTTQFPVNGIFVLKHTRIIAELTPVQVLYAFSTDKEQNERFRIVETSQNNFTETIVYYKPSKIKIVNQFVQVYSFWKGFQLIRNKLGLPSVIHNHVVFPAGFFALFLSLLYNIPLLITEHWTGYSEEDGRYSKLSFFHHFIFKKAFSRAIGISVISEFLKKTLLEKKLINGKRTLLTFNVLAAPKKLAIDKGKYTKANKAICVANMDDIQKNLSGLIDAVSELVKEFPSFSVTLIGDGPQRKLLEQKTMELDLLDKNIFFCGNVPNEKIGEYYQSHDFFILNSNFETFSIATAEAIIHGLPVVVTRCGGPEEFVNSSNGILIEKRNNYQLKEAIKQMIKTYGDYHPAEISKSFLDKYKEEELKESMKQLYSWVYDNSV